MQTKQSKEKARELYMSSELTQVQIAQALGINRSTLADWISIGKWTKMKEMYCKTPMEFILHFEQEVRDINVQIASRPAGQRIPTTAEARLRSTILTSIHQMRGRITASATTDVMLAFMDYLKQNDYEDFDLYYGAANNFLATVVNTSMLTRIDPLFTVADLSDNQIKAE